VNDFGNTRWEIAGSCNDYIWLPEIRYPSYSVIFFGTIKAGNAHILLSIRSSTPSSTRWSSSFLNVGRWTSGILNGGQNMGSSFLFFNLIENCLWMYRPSLPENNLVNDFKVSLTNDFWIHVRCWQDSATSCVSIASYLASNIFFTWVVMISVKCDESEK